MLKQISLLFLVFILCQNASTYYCKQILRDRLSKDDLDMQRDWGVRFFKEGDIAFKDPEYIDLLTAAAEPYAHGGFATNDRSKVLKQVIESRFSRYWSLLANNTEAEEPYTTNILNVTFSGTEANNLLFKHASDHSENSRKGFVEEERVKLLSFQHTYNGVSGPVTRRIRRIAPSPYVESLEPIQDLNELEQIKKIEDKAIVFIRNSVNEDPTIHGILLEPITNGYYELLFFRPEFLLRLRELADTLDIPIFADEIFTGGGRTGKFWAFEHYPGFLPDLVTFGKGLIIAGVASIVQNHTKANPRHDAFYHGTTVVINQLALLQASQVLKTIYDRNLVENSAEVGSYMKKILGEDTQGIGLHLHHFDFQRITPPLTMTIEDVDRWARILKIPQHYH